MARKILVSADALGEVLRALSGPDYLIRELQAVRMLGDSPIDKLIKEYKAATGKKKKVKNDD